MSRATDTTRRVTRTGGAGASPTSTRRRTASVVRGRDSRGRRQDSSPVTSTDTHLLLFYAMCPVVYDRQNEWYSLSKSITLPLPRTVKFQVVVGRIGVSVTETLNLGYVSRKIISQSLLPVKDLREQKVSFVGVELKEIILVSLRVFSDNREGLGDQLDRRQ